MGEVVHTAFWLFKILFMLLSSMKIVEAEEKEKLEYKCGEGEPVYVGYFG